MKNRYVLIFFSLLLNCSENNQLQVDVTIKGLKKGTVFLKKYVDSSLVAVDSTTILGNETITLKSEIESPEMFYLQLDKNSKEDEVLSFFADRGITTITTTLKNFMFDASIKGSRQQEELENYQKVIARYNNKNLELLKEELEAKIKKDTATITTIETQYESLLRSKYFYTINYAMLHNHSEIAPYLALTELPNAHKKWLDTINSVLTPKVKASKYGKALQKVISKK